MTDERKIDLIKDHFDLEISDNIDFFNTMHCAIYSESTADGYDVFIVTNDPTNVSVCEDVYYYDHDIGNAFRDQIRWGDTKFYIDDYIYEDCYIEDQLLEMFEEYVHDIDSKKFTDAEREYIKEEYAREDEEYIKTN